MQRAGLRRIMISDGVDPDRAERAVEVFVTAPREVWRWIVAWVGEREFKAAQAEDAAGKNLIIGEPPWLIPPLPARIPLRLEDDERQ